MATQRTSRPKPAPPGNEEASSTLNLGDFQNVETLSFSEAALVLSAITTKRKADNKDQNQTEMLNQTMTYLDAFARFTEKENVEAVERLLTARKELAYFERAQLGTLVCSDSEEAKSLIPSLADKISDEDLEELVQEIAKLQNK